MTGVQTCALPISETVITPEVISPNNDGFEDFAEINLRFPDLDNRLTISIYNARGKLVKHLANNVLCGNEAQFRWEGLDDQNQLLPSGMYVVMIQYWNLSGQSKRIKRVLSIANW